MNLEELVLEQLHAWDRPARGWLCFDEPVHLEPPFEPFLGHFLPEVRAPDDGRRSTFVSRFLERLRRRPTPEEIAPLPVTERQPRLAAALESGGRLAVYSVGLTREAAPRAEAMTALLMALRAAELPVSFEVVGTAEGIALQMTCRESDQALFTHAFRSYFPEAEASPGVDRLYAWHRAHEDAIFEVAQAGYHREFMIPLRLPESRAADPLLAFVAALEDLHSDEAAALQVIFEPAHARWPESIFRAVSDNEGGDFFLNAPHIGREARRKALQPLFAVVVRIAAAGPVATRHNRLRRLATALGQFEAPDRNAFFVVNSDEMMTAEGTFDFLLRQSRWCGMLWSLEELTALVHLPDESVASPSFLARGTRPSKIVPSHKPSGLHLGTNLHAGRSTAVYLSPDQLGRHVHIIGASGSGKTTLLLRLLSEAAETGLGFALLDPHGDLVDDLLTRIPEDREKDIVLFDPSDAEQPVGFNVLAAHSETERMLLESDLVGIFRRLSTSWGDQMHTVLANAIQAMLASPRPATIADLRSFLVDADFRRTFMTTIEEPETAYYWAKQYPLLRGRPEGPILTRLDNFLRPRPIRNMVTQAENKLNFRRIMDSGGIFLAKLAHGAIGEENAALLGSFLTAKFHQVALSRQDLARHERRAFLLAMDEFQHFVTPSMASLLSGSRKFGLGLLLAHQELHQLQARDAEVLSAVLANAGTRVVFRVGDADARALADGFRSFSADDLRTQDTGEAICRFGRADWDFNVRVPAVRDVDEGEATARRERIRELSRKNYGGLAPLPVSSRVEEAPSEPQRPARANEAEKPLPRETASQEPTAPPSLGRGGAEHKYLQQLVKQFGEAAGYRATIEKPVLDGSGSVDVALESATKNIAVEISVASSVDYEVANAVKCLEAGFQEVVLLVNDPTKRAKIEKAAKTELGAEPRLRVIDAEAFVQELAGMTTPTTRTAGGYRVSVRYETATSSPGNPRDVLAKTLAASISRPK